LVDDESTPNAAGASSVHDGGYVVLIVEDDKDAAMLTRMLLEAAGHEVSVAHSGPAALEAVGSKAFDTVFLDLGLPDMAGGEVLQALKQRVRTARTRFVCLSGRSESDIDWRGLGFDHYLEKPAAIKKIKALLGPKTQ
jgi:CheY-like chemotaxis protein